MTSFRQYSVLLSKGGATASAAIGNGGLNNTLIRNDLGYAGHKSDLTSLERRNCEPALWITTVLKVLFVLFFFIRQPQYILIIFGSRSLWRFSVEHGRVVQETRSRHGQSQLAQFQHFPHVRREGLQDRRAPLRRDQARAQRLR